MKKREPVLLEEDDGFWTELRRRCSDIAGSVFDEATSTAEFKETFSRDRGLAKAVRFVWDYAAAHPAKAISKRPWEDPKKKVN
ncbi:MAG TPA: hypothetical protein VMT99_02630 [Candidatus Paceibacterota bacterium]|nr:hypothetical protein [Candidatus Paceibacterota bacterium]